MNTLTYSSIQAFKSCRKRYQYRYEIGIEPAERPIYFSLGSAVHVGLEHIYRGSNQFEIENAINIYFAKNAPSNDDIERLNEWDSSRRMAHAIIDRYRENYKEERFQIIETEKQFCLPIVNPETGSASQTYQIMGKIDGIARENGHLWIIEHKTTSAISNQYKKGLTLDAQSILYVDAMERVFNEPVQGVIYNVLLKSVPHKPALLKNGKLSTDKRQVTTAELYRKAIAENFLSETDYSEFIAFLESSQRSFFYREYLTFTKSDREQWRNELWDIAKDIRQCELNDRFYRNTSQCCAMRTCQYFDICCSLDQESVIKSSYKHVDDLNPELEQEESVTAA